MIFDQAMTMLVHCFLPEGVAVEEARLLVLSWWCFFCCYKEWITLADFSFLEFFFFWMCASVMPLGHCVIAEARCN
jgi:hypothetical protein